MVVILSLVPMFLLANPIKIEVLNEFQADKVQQVELHFTYPAGPMPLLNDTIITPSGTALIDTDIYLWDSDFVVIDTSMLTGPFAISQDTGFIKFYSFDIDDTLQYPFDAYYYIIPSPPSGASVAKFYCWINSGSDMWMLKDWYIDYTPTLGAPNDDYYGCKISGYVYEDTTPINGAQVIARVAFYIYTQHPFYDCCTTYTSVDGFYSFDSLLPAKFWVQVSAPGYLPDSQLTEYLHAIEPVENLDFYLTGIEEDRRSGLHNLLSIYPNPFKNAVTIEYSLFSSSNSDILIYDISGQVVRKLLCRTRLLDNNRIVWHAENLPEGVYFVQLESPQGAITEKVVKIK